jgi:hypothetical protein
VLLALILASAPLTDATRAYADLEYETCVSRLSGLKGIPSAERAKAELLLGLCHFALGHEKQARALVSSALGRDANVTPPANASPKELEFIKAQSPAAPEKLAVRKTPKPKSPEVVEEPVVPAPPPVEPEPVAPVAVASPDAGVDLTPTQPVASVPAAVEAAMKPEPLPPQKATWLPWLTGGIAVAAAGVGTGLGVNAASLETKGRAEPVQVDAARLGADAQANATGANIAFAVAGTAAVTTIVAFILTR